MAVALSEGTTRPGRPLVVIVTGVMGAGKTLIGTLLARRLGWRFLDADDVHSPRNRAKIAAGIALTEEDRVPWLAALHDAVAGAVRSGDPMVLACSALRASYRAALVPDDGPPGAVRFVLLDASPALARARAGNRVGHFAAAALVPSQFDALELPEPGEALVVDAARAPDAIVEDILSSLGGAAGVREAAS